MEWGLEKLGFDTRPGLALPLIALSFGAVQFPGEGIDRVSAVPPTPTAYDGSPKKGTRPPGRNERCPGCHAKFKKCVCPSRGRSLPHSKTK